MTVSQHQSSPLQRLRLHAQASQEKLATQFPQAHKKLKSLNLSLRDLRHHTGRVLSAAALAGGLLTLTPTVKSALQPTHQEELLSREQLEKKVKEKLDGILPPTVGPLPPEIERLASDTLVTTLGVHATAQLEGNHLNTSYGYMGAEQHLPRFPGDTINQHDELQTKGITPGLGAFGYFAPSKQRLSTDDVMKEKYYVAVQTLYLPNWKTDYKALKDWYKFRRVLVVNPKNGKSVVAVVGDAGPAAWTGKQFGGSPEIMAELELNHGKQKGAVLLFFINEKSNHVALGPIETKQAIYLAKK